MLLLYARVKCGNISLISCKIFDVDLSSLFLSHVRLSLDECLTEPNLFAILMILKCAYQPQCLWNVTKSLNAYIFLIRNGRQLLSINCLPAQNRWQTVLFWCVAWRIAYSCRCTANYINTLYIKHDFVNKISIKLHQIQSILPLCVPNEFSFYLNFFFHFFDKKMLWIWLWNAEKCTVTSHQINDAWIHFKDHL